MAGSAESLSNRAFLANLALALVTLALSGLLLVTLCGGWALAQFTGNPTETEPSEARHYDGDSLIVRLGTGAPAPDHSLQLQQPSDDRIIATTKTYINASDYPFVRVDLEHEHHRQYVYFVWRQASDPGTLHNAMLFWDNEKPVYLNLSNQKAWSGAITELGIDVYGDLREQPLTLKAVDLLPASKATILQNIWSEWTVMRGWTQRSVHQLPGVPEGALVSPTVAAAAWAGLSLSILALLALVLRRPLWVAAALSIMLPWIAIDLLWQHELDQNLAETKYLYSDKSTHDKHLAERDANLYRYAQHLKSDILPEPGVRIFLLHDSDHQTYTRLKFQYYLLPHNLYNYTRYPNLEQTRSGDYIVVLAEVPGLRYNSKTKQLLWQQQSLPVERLEQSEEGAVYRVTKGDKS